MLGGVPMKQRAIPVRALIPNLLTTIALCCGLAALHFAVKEHWDRALAAVAMSAIFDALDGRAARLLRVTSRFGAVLDSLSDFLSFGVAPAMIIHQWMLHSEQMRGNEDHFVLGAAMTFALCSALRLARFTASIPPTISAGGHPAPNPLAGKFFVGMPTPAAAGCVLIPVMIDQSRTFDWKASPWVVITFTFFVAWLMISRRPMFAFKKLRVGRAMVVPLLVVVGLLVTIAAKDPWLAATVLSGLYLLSLPASMISYHRAAAVLGQATGTPAGWSAGPSLRDQLSESSAGSRSPNGRG